MVMNISNQQLQELREAFSRLRPTVSISGNTVSIDDRKSGQVSLSLSPSIAPTFTQIRG